MPSLVRSSWLALCILPSLWASDISGRWSGVIAVDDPGSGVTINQTVKVEIADSAGAISGSIRRKEDERAEPIRNAKRDGKNLLFEVRSEDAGAAVKFNLLLVADGRLEGDMKGMAGSAPIRGRVKLERTAEQAAN